ncbi:MAG: hypothetical protein R6U78_08890 [Bacteroidales bacterium]
MIINTAERFLVSIQHPERSRFLLPGHVRSAGLVGSVLLDLSNEKNIGIEHGKLVLIDACSMYRIICRDRREKKRCKAKIRDLIRSDSISRGVDEVIRATQAAIIAAVVASGAVASAGSN